jgi:CheY-like chemotaxis protein
MEISYAMSAAEALGFIASEGPFDAALIDTSLPEMDGWELMKSLRASPETASLPIGMMAGILEDVDPAKAENAPIQFFLRKPVDLRDLVDKVNALLSIPATTNFATAPLAEPVPSDLLLLEEQDLAEDIAFTPAGVVTTELPPMGQQDDSEPSGAADASEEVFSLELEELDLNSVGDFAISAPEFDAEGGDLSDVIESDPILPEEGAAAEDTVFSGTIELEARPAAARGATGSGLLDILESNAQQPQAPTDGNDLMEMPNIISTNLLDTSPDDFGPEVLLDENLDGLSPLVAELLTNPKFINALAKAVAKNLDRQG